MGGEGCGGSWWCERILAAGVVWSQIKGTELVRASNTKKSLLTPRVQLGMVPGTHMPSTQRYESQKKLCESQKRLCESQKKICESRKKALRVLLANENILQAETL